MECFYGDLISSATVERTQVYVRSTRCLPDFKQIWCCSAYFYKISQIKVHVKPSSVNCADTYGQMDGRSEWRRTGRETDSLISFQSNGALYWLFHLAGNSKTYVGLHAYFCPILTNIEVNRHVYIEVPIVRFHGSPSGDLKADRQADLRTWRR
jgi:hypothetical protein